MVCTAKVHPETPTVYQIRLHGQLGVQWSDWFKGMTISPAENGDALQTRPVADQAALFGLLRKVRNLSLPLISINCIEPDLTGSQGG